MADAPAVTDPPAEPTATPDATSELGDAGKKALDTERAARKAADKQVADMAARLKAIEDKDKSDLERANEARIAAEQSAADTAKELLRHRVGVEKRLPPEIVELLQGDTQEEMAAHADRLAAVVKQASRPAGSVDAGRTGDAPKQSPAQEFSDFLARAINKNS